MPLARFALRQAVTTALICASGAAQTTTRVSVDSAGAQGINGSSVRSSMSADGRYVAFMSQAVNLVPGDSNHATDIFVHDCLTGATRRVSVSSAGIQGNNASEVPSISANGQYVAFATVADNLVTGDTNLQSDVLMHDLLTGQTIRVSVDSAGNQGNIGSAQPSLSADGRYVAFISGATNLVPGDTNGLSDVFVHDRQTGATARASVDLGGVQSNGNSWDASLSPDGRYVAFTSDADNLTAGDSNGVPDVFVHDAFSGLTTLASVDSNGAQGNGPSMFPSIALDGRYVAFQSDATNLVSGDINACSDVLVRNLVSGSTTRVSVNSGGAEGNSGSGAYYGVSISYDGGFVAFRSDASNLVPGDTNGCADIFVSNLVGGSITRVSVYSGGAEANGGSDVPTVSAGGRFVVFESTASNLVSGDTNGERDIFVCDRGVAFTVTPFCMGDGTDGPCPCGNTGQVGHGCDNSIGTGGAVLAGSGEALLSADRLILTSSNERPTSVSLFWQGGSEIAARPFGDGVGCMGPLLKRLYGHNAVGGVVSAPQGSDLPVSARSAALGDPISAGEIRVYHVFYRDPDPNFCDWPLGSTFNVSSGLRVLWAE